MKVDYQLSMLFEKQAILDSRILNEKSLQGKDLLFNKILSTVVEVSELANEWQGFKVWKKNSQPKPGMLVEYVDGLHFVLSLGIEIDFSLEDWEIESTPCCDGILIQILEIKSALIDMYRRRVKVKGNYEETYVNLLEMYIGLSEMLGFTWEQVLEAYKKKNKINHERQTNGY